MELTKKQIQSITEYIKTPTIDYIRKHFLKRSQKNNTQLIYDIIHKIFEESKKEVAGKYERTCNSRCKKTLCYQRLSEYHKVSCYSSKIWKNYSRSNGISSNYLNFLKRHV